MNKIVKIIYKLLAVIFLILVIGFTAILLLTNEASETAQSYLSEASVDSNVIHFQVDNPTHSIIVYPGGFVEAESYAHLASLLQDEGYEVFIVKMPLHIAAFNRFAYEDIIATHERDNWVLMGHSLGGAMMSYVDDTKIEKLIYLAAYPPSSVDLSRTNLKVLSITASEDLVLDWDNYQDSKSSLPDSTIYVEIDGGNHARFGDYGAQRGDGTALISVKNQHQQVVKTIKTFLDN